MTSSIAAAEAEGVSSARVIEKQPLERYVAPARPSLVGLPRTDLAAALGGIGVAPPQQRMRVQQIWQWLYVRGAPSFDAMTTLPKDLRAALAEGEGLSISKRRITLSTSGVVPNIARAGAEIGVMLAVSLHAVTDELRDELVPLNRKYPLRDLLDACRLYPGLSNARRITFE